MLSKNKKQNNKILPRSVAAILPYRYTKKPWCIVLPVLALLGLVIVFIWWQNSQASTRGAAYDRLGIYPSKTGQYVLDELTPIETRINRQVSYVVQFGLDSSITLTDNLASRAAEMLGPRQPRTHISMTIPLVFGSNAHVKEPNSSDPNKNGAKVRQDLIATANGINDSGYRDIALALKNNGYSDAVLRLGHEFDGAWYSWSARAGCTEFKNAWKRVHGIFKGVSADFRFDYNGTKGNFKEMAECAYPGNSYVDIIGLDIYDRGESPSYFDSSKPGWIDPEWMWTNKFLPRLQEHRNFAVSKGKPVSYPEWALQGLTDAGNVEGDSPMGGDNPRYIQGMYDWMNALPATGAGSLVYSGYFWTKVYALDYKKPNGEFLYPNALAKFQQLFGGSITSVLTPGDTDGNGIVNALDLGTVLTNYGRINATLAQGDVFPDTRVDAQDLARVLTNYGLER